MNPTDTKMEMLQELEYPGRALMFEVFSVEEQNDGHLIAASRWERIMQRRTITASAVLALVSLVLCASPAHAAEKWWNNRYHFRFSVSVDAGMNERTDEIIRRNIDFADMLRRMGSKGALDKNSIRVVQSATEDAPAKELPSAFFPVAPDEAKGSLVWKVTGTIPPMETREAFVYFDTAANGQKKAPQYPDAKELTAEDPFANMIKNPGFEEGAAGRPAVARHWEKSNISHIPEAKRTGKEGACVRTTKHARSGKYSLMVANNLGKFYYLVNQPALAAKGKQQYVLEGYVKIVSTEGNPEIGIGAWFAGPGGSKVKLEDGSKVGNYKMTVYTKPHGPSLGWIPIKAGPCLNYYDPAVKKNLSSQTTLPGTATVHINLGVLNGKAKVYFDDISLSLLRKSRAPEPVSVVVGLPEKLDLPTLILEVVGAKPRAIKTADKAAVMKYVAVPAAVPPTIDGKLNDTCWRKAASTEKFVEFYFDKVAKNRYADVGTNVFVAFDRHNVYVAARLSEPAMGKLRSLCKAHDDKVWNDDCFEIWLDPTGQKRKMYHLIVNSDGAVWDAVETHVLVEDPEPAEPGHMKLMQKDDPSWNGKYEMAGGREKDAWTVEVRIPTQTLGLTENIYGATWGVNFGRERYAGKAPELSSWTGVFTHPPDRFGDLILGKRLCKVAVDYGNLGHGKDHVIANIQNVSSAALSLKAFLNASQEKQVENALSVSIAPGETKQLRLPYSLDNAHPRYTLAFVLRDVTSGKIVFKSAQEGKMAAPVSFTIDPAIYYVGDTAMKAKVKVALGREALKECTLAFRLLDKAGRTVAAQRLSAVPGPRFDASLNLKLVTTEGRYQVQVILSDKDGNEIAKETKWLSCDEGPFAD